MQQHSQSMDAQFQNVRPELSEQNSSWWNRDIKPTSPHNTATEIGSQSAELPEQPRDIPKHVHSHIHPAHPAKLKQVRIIAYCNQLFTACNVCGTGRYPTLTLRR